MAYVVPSPLVYQQLASSGGVMNSTPDLDACIIGPAYNVLHYIAGNTASMVKTAAAMVTAPIVVTMAVGVSTITFTSAPAVTVGDVLMVPGAGLAGATLQTKVTAVAGLVVTVDTQALTAVTAVTATKQGSLTNTSVTNAFSVAGQLPGQLVDPTSVQVYLNNAKVETLATNFYGFAGSSSLTNVPVTGTGSITTGTRNVTAVTTLGNLIVGDIISIAGAGVAGAALITKVAALGTGTITLDANYPAAGATVTGAAITQPDILNISPVTSTLILEPGDQVVINYTNNVGVASTFTTSANSVVSPTGAITSVTITDMLPTDVSRTTTLTAAASSGATSVTVGSATGINVGDMLLIKDIGGVVGNDFTSVITVIAGSTLTLQSPLSAAAVINSAVRVGNQVTLRTRKAYNNQLLGAFKISNSLSANYDLSSVATNGQVTISVSPELAYGVVKSADVYIAYRALRTDLSGSVITIANTNDIVGVLGDTTDENPLALGVLMAKVNTNTQVKCIAVSDTTLVGYQAAFDLAEGQRLYAITPLTQDQSILAAAAVHVKLQSTPVNANWRVALVNTAIPTSIPVGPFSSGLMNVNGGNNAIAVSAGKYVLTASNATFISDGVVPGDTIAVYNGSTLLGNYTVLTLISNQQVVLNTTSAASGVSYYVSRMLSKTQRAQAVAAVSKGFGSNRVIHIQPDTVGININGAIKYLPGYYLCAAVAGLIAGFPVQQGFTNIGVAGVADIKYSNFYFTRAQLNTMAEAGTFLFVQDTNGSIPYVRHELTTDVSTLEYRELLVVKNWDFLSYFYYDKTKMFIGTWNITTDTLNTVRHTIDASSALLKSQKLPKIGPPLIDATIVTLGQNALNKDMVDLQLQIVVVYPFNYLNIYLTI